MIATREDLPVPDETSVESGLLIRIWTERDPTHALRARVLTVGHGRDEPRGWATVTGEDAVLAAVERWLAAHRRESE